MNIAFVAPEYAPFLDLTGRGCGTAALVDEFVAMGHEVCVVMPFPSGENMDAHSLARRLMPITVQVDNQPVKAIRYDGRSLSGVSILLLEVPAFEADTKAGRWPAGRIEGFGKAAAAVLQAANEPVDVCISFGAESACVPMAFTGEKKRPAHVLVINGDPQGGGALLGGVEAADRVVLSDGVVAEGLSENVRNLLAARAKKGEAVTLSAPRTHGDENKALNKSSDKAAFQLGAGLPVRTDVPLVCFPEALLSAYPDSLSALLTREVQVVVNSTSDALAVLAERYGDRLALVSEEKGLPAVLAGADACICGKKTELAALATEYGALPVVHRGIGAGFVDIEPSCQTGSAITFAGAPEDVCGRLLAAFATGAAFQTLLRRLPTFGPSQKDIANYLSQVVQSIKLL